MERHANGTANMAARERGPPMKLASAIAELNSAVTFGHCVCVTQSVDHQASAPGTYANPCVRTAHDNTCYRIRTAPGAKRF